MAVLLSLASANSPEWPQWRGPFNNGMAAGDAPLQWDADRRPLADSRSRARPLDAGRRRQPAVSDDGGTDREGDAAGDGGTRRRWRGRRLEHRFDVLAIDRTTGKIAWQRTATVATPHEGYHRIYGSFASNSPVTDGTRVFAFFGSRGLYAYDMTASCSGRRTSACRCGWTWPSARARR